MHQGNFHLYRKVSYILSLLWQKNRKKSINVCRLTILTFLISVYIIQKIKKEDEILRKDSVLVALIVFLAFLLLPGLRKEDNASILFLAFLPIVSFYFLTLLVKSKQSEIERTGRFGIILFQLIFFVGCALLYAYNHMSFVELMMVFVFVALIILFLRPKKNNQIKLL